LCGEGKFPRLMQIEKTRNRVRGEKRKGENDWAGMGKVMETK